MSTTLRGMFPDENSRLATAFFSSENRQKIQNGLRYLAKQSTGLVIDCFDPTELFLVMRAVYLVNCKFTDDPTKMRAEIARLNDLIFVEWGPKVISEVVGYMNYLHDIEKPLQAPMDPIATRAEIKNMSSMTASFIGPRV